MLSVNNQIIVTEIPDIIETLKSQLELDGIHMFAKTIISGNNVQTCCPFHNGGQERKPSFGILTVDRGSSKAGSCHCFACGWSGSLSEMISNCFGRDDLGIYGSKWLISNFLTLEVDNRNDLDLDVSRGRQKISNTYVSEEELDTYREYHPYMWKRKLTPEVVEIFDIGYDRKTQCITFPNRDINGNCLFVARRSVNTKFFKYPKDVYKPVYGMYELSQLDEQPEEVYICESMLDATTIWAYGKHAVALNGLGDELQFNVLKNSPYRKFILATDNDERGLNARKKLFANLDNKIVTQVLFPEGKKDINELTKDEFYNLKEIF